MALGLTRGASAQTTQPIDPATSPRLPFGTNAFAIPPAEKKIVVSERQIELLSAALSAATDTERTCLVAEVARCGPAGVPLLAKYASDPSPAVRGEVARTIAVNGRAEAKDLLTALMADGEAFVRRETVIAAARLGRDELILAGLSDADASAQRAALQCAGTPEQARRLAELLPNLPNGLKPVALRTLGRIDPKNYVSLFAAQLQSDVATRVAATEGLGLGGFGSDAKTVRALLADAAPSVRRAALIALGKIGSPAEQQDAAMAGLDDQDPTVRTAAAELLKTHPKVEAMPALRRQLEADTSDLHDAAREALAVLGNPVRPIAEALLTDAKPTLRMDGAFLLGRIRSTASIERHLTLLDDSDWAVVSEAARSLGELNLPPERLAPYLKRILQRTKAFGEPKEDEINAVADSILLAGKTGCADVVDLLEPLVPVYAGRESAPDLMRRAAIWSIGVLANPDSPAAQTARKVMSSTTQSPGAILESIKASVNLRDRSVQSFLSGWRTEQTLSREPSCRWMAHWASDFFQGQHTAYEPLVLDQPVVLSVLPLAGGN